MAGVFLVLGDLGAVDVAEMWQGEGRCSDLSYSVLDERDLLGPTPRSMSQAVEAKFRIRVSFGAGLRKASKVCFCVGSMASDVAGRRG